MELSLPPGIDSAQHGVLRLSVGSLIWMASPFESQNTVFQIKFWGESHMGILLRPPESVRQSTMNHAEYKICTPKGPFAKYLEDMSVLQLDVIDDRNMRIIGNVQIQLRLYIKRDDGNLEIFGSFPIIAPNGKDKLGDVEFTARTDYAERVRTAFDVADSIDSFKLNEIKAQEEVDSTKQSVSSSKGGTFKVPKKALTKKTDYDIPKEQVPGGFSQPKGPIPGGLSQPKEPIPGGLSQPKEPIPGLSQGKEPIPGLANYNAPSAIPQVPSAIPKQQPFPEPTKPTPSVDPGYKPGIYPTSYLSTIPENPPKAHPTKPDLPPTESQEWQRMQEKGDALRERMFNALGGLPTFGDETLVLDNVKENEATIANLEIPLDPMAVPHPTEQTTCFSDIKEMRYLKLSITTLTILTEKASYLDKHLYLECIIPIPSQTPANIIHDSLKINHKGCLENIFKFSHESMHEINTMQEGIFSKLSAHGIKFKAWISDNKGGNVEFGRGEVQWEKVMLASGFQHSAVVEMWKIETAKTVGRGGRMQQPAAPQQTSPVGRLSITLELLQGDDDQRKEPSVAIPSIPAALVTAPQQPVIQQPPPQVVVKSYQLYLNIDSASQLFQREDGAGRNVFITYKTFPDFESISTPVQWNYIEKTKIDHKMIFPVTNADAAKLQAACLVLEVWDKVDPSKDELMGLVKLPLKLFGLALETLSFVNCVYPVTAYDEFRPIHNLRSGKDIGYLRICLAMGTSSQVHRLNLTHTQQGNLPQSPNRQKLPSDQSPQQKPLDQSPSKNDRKEAPIPTSSPDQPVETREEPKHGMGVSTTSMESIGDIASFLNRKEAVPNQYDDEQPERDVPEIPASTQPMPEMPSSVPRAADPPMPTALPEMPQNPTMQPQYDIESPQRNYSPPIRSNTIPEAIYDDDPRSELRALLRKSNINLEEELRLYDPFNYGTIERIDLLHLLKELGMTISKAEALLAEIAQQVPSPDGKTFNLDSVLCFCGQSKPANTKHIWDISVDRLINFGTLQNYPKNSLYVKLKFPGEETYIESRALPLVDETTPVDLRSTHACTVCKDGSLKDYFPESSLGLSVQLCSTDEIPERVVAHAMLPTEEILEIQGSTVRVLCLYSDQSIVGKVRMSIRYQKEMTVDQPSVAKSSEVIIEKTTEIERMLPKENTLTCFLERLSELHKGKIFWKSQGLDIDYVYCKLSLFADEAELNNANRIWQSKNLPFKQDFFVEESTAFDLTFNEQVLDYFKNKSAWIELCSGDDVLGTCKISLLPLLINSSLSGCYPLLNGYGQFLGSVFLTFTFSRDEIQRISSPHRSPQKSPAKSPVRKPDSPIKPVIEAAVAVSASRKLFQESSYTEHMPSPSRPYKDQLDAACTSKAMSNEMFLSQADDQDLREKFKESLLSLDNMLGNLSNLGSSPQADFTRAATTDAVEQPFKTDIPAPLRSYSTPLDPVFEAVEKPFKCEETDISAPLRTYSTPLDPVFEAVEEAMQPPPAEPECRPSSISTQQLSVQEDPSAIYLTSDLESVKNMEYKPSTEIALHRYDDVAADDDEDFDLQFAEDLRAAIREAAEMSTSGDKFSPIKYETEGSPYKRDKPKVQKPPLPKGMAPEISRIAAIMKSSKY